MHPTNRLFATIAAAAFSFSAFADDGILPSEFTVLVNHALEAEPGVDRKSITTPLIARLRTEGLSEIQRFHKGEVHFLHLEPEDSRDAYWEFRDRDDDFGRVANQRLMVIRINGFRMIDAVLDSDIPRYYERFDVRSDDRHGISFPVQRTAELLADRGENQRALDLVVDHVRRHDRFDAPYSAYALPGQFHSLAAESGRAQEFDSLNEWVLEGLNRTIDERLANPVNDGPKATGIPGEVFFSLFADRKLDGYEWTAEFLELRDRIAAGIATARGRPGQ